jgi:uncharacterized protein (TIGR02452 family)
MDPRSISRSTCVQIGRKTLLDIDAGSFELNGTAYALDSASDYCKEHTKYFSPSSFDNWAQNRWEVQVDASHATDISIQDLSTIQGIRAFEQAGVAGTTIGILNFASAKSPGGGFLGMKCLSGLVLTRS